MESQLPEIPEKKSKFKKWLKPLLWVFVSFIFIVLLSVTLVFVYEDEIKSAVIEELNQHLNAEISVKPESIDLTIIRSFPNTSLDFKELTCFEATNNKNRDTLFVAERISFQFNVMDIFHEKYDIKKIDCSNLDLRLVIDENGKQNYNVWKEDTANSTKNEKVSFSLEDVSLKKIKCSFKNKKEKTKLLFTLNKAVFKGKFNDINYALTTEGEMYLNYFTYKKTNYLRNKNVNFNVELEVKENLFSITSSELQINEVYLSVNGNLQNNNKIIVSNLNFIGKNLDVTTALSLLPQSQQERIKDYEGEGVFYLKGSIAGPLNSDQIPDIKADFGFQNASLTYKPNNVTAKNLTISGSYNNTNGYDELLLKKISASINNNLISGDFKLIDFNEPYIDTKFKLNADLKEIIMFYPIDTLSELSGIVFFEGEVKGKFAQLQKDFTDASNYSKGNARFSNVKFNFKNDEHKWDLPYGKLSFSGNNLITDSLKLTIGSSDVDIKGSIINFLPWLLKENEQLSINANCNSNFISLDELIKSSSSSTEEFSFPSWLSFNIQSSVKNIKLGKFSANTITGNIQLLNNKLYSDNISFQSMGGSASLSGIMEENKQDISIKGTAVLKDIDVNRMMYEMNNFSQDEILDKHVKGKGNFSFDFSTLWNKKWECNFDKLVANFDVQINQGELKEYKPLESLAKYIELKELQNIKFNALNCHLAISNRVIDISKTKINNSALNMEFYGTHDFENNINYHVKLLLSELIAKRPGKNKKLDDELLFTENDTENKRCVFINMKGNIDNPVITYDRKAMKEKIKEDIKNEKQNLKSILKEEFGFFKKDTSIKANKNENKADQRFIIDNNTKQKEKENKLQPKKKKEEDEDF
jgi:hypothetical protein